MKKLLIICFAILLSGFTFAPAKINLQGDTLHFVGDLNQQSLEKFNKFVSKINVKKLKTFKINSSGGDIVAGIKIAEFIKQNNLNVEVYDMCFSSCANYIFMSGREKLIHDGTILGWHGDVKSSANFTTEQESKEDIKKQLSKYIKDKDELEKIVQRQWEKVFIHDPKLELQFYEQYNINTTAIRYGHQNKEIFEKLKKGKYMGWTFSPQIMKQFGIKNVNLVTGSWKPAFRGNAKILYIDKLK